MEKSKTIYAYDPAKNKKIKAGVLVVDVFIKKVTIRHYMRSEKGYGIQEEVIDRLKKEDCKHIIIMSKRHSYLSKISQWEERPVRDYGHGYQQFLRIDRMEKTDNKKNVD